MLIMNGSRQHSLSKESPHIKNVKKEVIRSFGLPLDCCRKSQTEEEKLLTDKDKVNFHFIKI